MYKQAQRVSRVGPGYVPGFSSCVAGEKLRSFISSIIRSRKISIKASLSEIDSRKLSLPSGKQSKERSMRK
jgi:hypothetical protein